MSSSIKLKRKQEYRIKGVPYWKRDILEAALDLEYDRKYIDKIANSKTEDEALLYMGFARHQKWD